MRLMVRKVRAGRPHPQPLPLNVQLHLKGGKVQLLNHIIQDSQVREVKGVKEVKESTPKMLS
ncbi:MAG: hypothetical protein ACI3Y0_03545, partial [Prevotella sp.]